MGYLFKPGDTVDLRLWFGQIVTAKIHKRFLFMCLVLWGVRSSWDGSPPFKVYTKTKWRPVWRLL